MLAIEPTMHRLEEEYDPQWDADVAELSIAQV